MTSVINILVSQAVDTLMQNLTKVVLFVISLPLLYFIHKEIRQADQDWAREVLKAEQELKRETLYQKWVQSDRNRYGAGIGNWSAGSFGLQQAKKIWKLTHPNENRNPYSSQVLREKTGGPNTDVYMLTPWYHYVMLTIICWMILSAIIVFCIKKFKIV